MPTRILARHASYGPEALKVLGEIFDEVWASVAPNFDEGADIEAVRMRLATIILDLASDGQLGIGQIKRTAGRLIRQDSSNGIMGPAALPPAERTVPEACNSPASHGGLLDPEALHTLRLCFDDVWREIAGNFSADKVEAARSKLATLILRLAGDERHSRQELGRAAMLHMRRGARPRRTSGSVCARSIAAFADVRFASRSTVSGWRRG